MKSKPLSRTINEHAAQASLRLEGFEPPTYGSVGHCSIQLSYRRFGPIAEPFSARRPREICNIGTVLPSVNSAVGGSLAPQLQPRDGSGLEEFRAENRAATA